ncbi:MAG: DUF4124 domain-containing protein [Vibrionaceae bacterium]
MRISLLVGLLILSSVTHAQEYYEWRDANGIINFSDTPPDQSYTTRRLTGPAEPPAAPPEATSAPEMPPFPTSQNVPEDSKPARASKVFLIAPENKQTIRDNTGKVTVSLGSDQPLAKGQTLRVMLDEQAQPASTRVVHTLENVVRGEHSISAQLLDNDKVIFSSPAQIFYMHQAIVKREARESSEAK